MMGPVTTPRLVLALLLLGSSVCLCQPASPGGTDSSAPRSDRADGADTAAEGREAGAPGSGSDTARPLPAIPELMHEVELNQRHAEAIEKNYVYHSVSREQELGSKGEIKKVTVTEADHFWLNGVPVNRVLRKNGRDLTPEERAKEDERLEKQTQKARERREANDVRGTESDPQGHEEVTVSRLLTLGAFSNPRRIELEGRPTIVVDYTGDPHAKTRNRAEDAIRNLAGTAWVDEDDKVLVRVEGHFASAFKIGAGLVVDVKKDTRFAFRQIRVNREVWLPASIEAEGAARAMLFFNFSGRVDIAYSDYRKFRASATVLPDISPEGETGHAPGESSRGH